MSSVLQGSTASVDLNSRVPAANIAPRLDSRQASLAPLGTDALPLSLLVQLLAVQEAFKIRQGRHPADFVQPALSKASEVRLDALRATFDLSVVHKD
jgi:hypothetical protein